MKFDSGIVVKVNPVNPVYDHFSLNGRATRVLSASSESDYIKDGATIPLAGKKLVAKIYHPEETRGHEGIFIQMAQEILKDRPDLKRHIPTLICSKDIKYSTRHIRDVLGLREKKPGSEGSNPRLVRILIFVLLDPITSLEDPGKIIQAWKGCVDCKVFICISLLIVV
ncbi:hypothetical protein BDQ12DRAFT_742957 [Crucibulum laeve]|uniref:Uncharacterized protein n=1 Tax=Crucibulum laeve TaxID=68775 RepID=A0A5C3MI64_9AGAR|nr:hypothetical protein BDQ12DRAFT_742957 [Crucibulum laeve]